MPNPLKLDILRELRESAGLSQSEAAKRCGLTSKQGRISLAKWEQGTSVPHSTRCARFTGYLWDDLGLRTDPQRFETIWEMLVGEWGWDPIGDREWRRLTPMERPSRPPHSHQVSNATTENATTKSCLPIPFQAPASISHFVGRADELDAARTLLTAAFCTSADAPADAPAGAASVALIGMGGMGKTTLAIHLAHALRDHFADGILWATAAITNPLDIAQSWAQAYGYDFSGLSDIESRAAAIRNVLAEKHALIIFDDVIDAATVRPLLPSWGGGLGDSDNAGRGSCRVLLTTRNHDIAASLNARPIAPPELTIDAGVDLLVRVLGAARVNAELGAARRICQIVEGLPLAVEIVAQRLFSRPQQTLGNMMGRLEDEAKRLDALYINDRAVRIAFEVSWIQLGREHQKLFSLMGVFEGYSFTSDAFARIADSDVNDIEDSLWSLQALSLLSCDHGKRYRQHALLADFAKEKLGNNCQPYHRLIRYYLHFAQENQVNYEVLESQLNEIMFGMEVAYRLEHWQAVLIYAHTLCGPWQTRSEYYRAIQGYAWAVDAAKAISDDHELAFCFLEWARICYEQSSFEECQSYLDKALYLAKETQNSSIVADAKCIMAILNLERGDYEDTDELINECSELYEYLNDAKGISKSILLRALLVLYTGQYDQAKQLCMQALDIQEKAQFTLESIQTMQILTDVALAQRDHEMAREYCERALKISEEFGRLAEIGECYWTLSQINRRLLDWEQTWYWAEKGKEMFERAGKRLYYTYALFEQSIVKAETGQVDQAIHILKACLAILTELRNNYNRVTYLKVLGDFYIQIGQDDNAISYWQQGLNIAKLIQHPHINQLDDRLKTASI